MIVSKKFITCLILLGAMTILVKPTACRFKESHIHDNVDDIGLKKKEIVKEIFSDFVVCKDEVLFEWNQNNASNSALENKKGKFSIHIYETPGANKNGKRRNETR